MKILVVDDIEDARIILATALEEVGYAVEVANNGVHALERAHLVRPDLIVSDILMPEMDGFELCRAVKGDQQLQTIPFILYTATYVEPRDEKLAIALGVSRFIVKPMEIGELIKLVEEVLKEHEEDKLVAPERSIMDEPELSRMYAESLASKLDKKVRELQRERQALQDSEEHKRLLLMSTFEAIYGVDLRGNCTFINPAGLRLLGYQDQAELVGQNMHALIHHTRHDGSACPEEECRISQAFREGTGTHADDEELWRKDRTSFPTEYWSYPVYKDDQLVGSVVTFLDITERKQAEEGLHHLNRALRTISKCSEVLIHATDETTLLQDLCKVIVEEGQYRLTWVGYAERDDAKTVRPVAQAGYEEGYLETLAITYDDTKRGQGPTGTAIRTGKFSIVKDVQSENRFTPWWADAVERGYASTIALPLVVGRQIFGALNIYASVSNAFGDEEINLLNKLADDLAFGITTLRARAAKEQADEALRQANVVVENSPTVLFRWKGEPGWPVELVSQNVIQFGVSAQDMLSGAVRYSDLIHPDDLGRIEHTLADYAKRGIDQFTEEHRIVSPSSEVRWLEIHARVERDSQGRVTHYQGIAIDITERKAHIAELEHLAMYDSLTDLPNRALLQNRLEHAINRVHNEDNSVALIVLNLVRFKEINDTLGYQYGDRILQEVAKRLGMALGEKAVTVARLGGHEFAVVLPTERIERATQVVHKLEKIMEMPFSFQDTPIHIEIRAGIALYPDHADEPTELLKRADVALHLAEETKSNFTVYDADRDPFSLRRLTLFGELRQAISQDRLILYYQPQIDMKTNNIIAVEALARWPHPKGGMIPPSEFIPLAEHTGLIGPLTLWVLNTAVQQCQAWIQEGLHIKMAVNLSTRNLQDPELPDWLSGCLSNFGISPSLIILEITESAIMSNPERALNILKRLKAIGLSLSIDDFGTGYSSLTYLRKLPMDEIKVDQSFISAMTEHENDKVIVCSTIDLAHNLGLKVVAEGVEDSKTWEQLAALGCDIAQGYYISRPQSAADLTLWLHEPLSANIGKPLSIE